MAEGIYLGEKMYGSSGKKNFSRPNLYGTKDEKFFLKMVQYMWQQYVRNNSSTRYGGRSSITGKSFAELRLYALGQQDVIQYLELLDDYDPLTQEGHLNINLDIVQIIPKFRDIVKGKIIGTDYDVSTQALDETSSKERLKRGNKMKLLTDPAIRAFMDQTGLIPKDISLPEYIKTAEDVDMYIKMGGIRLDYEIAIKDAIESTKYESHYDTIKDKIIEDVIDLGICSNKTKLHPKTHKVMVDYVDPEYLIIQPSKYEDHRDSGWAGEICTKSIATLREESDLTEGQLMEIAKHHNGKLGNANLNLNAFHLPSTIEYQKSYRNDYSFDSTDIGWNEFSVNVLEAYFKAKDVERYIVGTREDTGNYVYDKTKKPNARLSKKRKQEGFEMEDNIIEKVYRCNWVIGTNFIYDYGEEYGIVKAKVNGVMQTLLPIQVYSNKSKSLVERCISFADDIQLATLKKRNALAKMAPGPRMIIDKSIVRDSVRIGKDEYSMLDLVNLYSKSGIFIVESKPEYDADEGASNRKPFDYMPSGIVEDLQIYLNDIQHNIDQIRQVTGLNEISDGSTPQQDILVRVMEGLNAAANNALRPHFRLYEGLYKNWCRYTVLKWQVALMTGDIDINFIPLGDTNIKTIKLSQGLTEYDYGIHITLIPSEEDKQLMLADLSQMKQNDRLAVEDYYVLYNMIRNGDIKKAQLYLAKAAKDFAAEMHRKDMEKIQAQGQANGQAASLAEQERAKTEAMILEGKMKLLEKEGEEERKTLALRMKLESQQNVASDARKLGNSVTEKAVDAMITQPQQQAAEQGSIQQP